MAGVGRGRFDSFGGGDGLQFDWLDRRWRWGTLAFWLCACGFLLWQHWARIGAFDLGDTDDNMRMMQVRGLLEGQGWYDLRQHHLAGSNIHWSRLVDLPIAALKLVFAPVFGGRIAEQIAVAVAPMLPMGVAMAALALIVRRLVAPLSYPLAIALLVCGGSVMGMWEPMRIDHHGWQLAFLAWTIAAFTDEKRGRGGAICGAASAASLVIGLEMIPYLAAAGALSVLMWVRDAGEARRLFAYGLSLGGACAFGFLLFASEANMAPLCDALTPVWLGTMLGAGGIAVALAMLSPRAALARLGLAALGGLVLAGSFAWTAPQCLGRLEQAPPELDRLWLSRVREAMPIWRHGWQTTVQTLTLPVFGLLGYGLMLWRRRAVPAQLIAWATLALMGATATGLLAWQTRAAPAAQLLAVPGATGLAWSAFEWLNVRRWLLVRVLGIVAAFIFVSGLATGYVSEYFNEPLSAWQRSVNIANNTCPTMWALGPIARQPRGMVLTFVDLGPRLITVTHHDAITGPYHRNAPQILDVMHAWRGSEATALDVVRRYHVDYVLICPNLSESTIYAVEAPAGFYVQLRDGRVPRWLVPVALPADSPYRMWRVAKR